MKLLKIAHEDEHDFVLPNYKQRELQLKKFVLIRHALHLARQSMLDARKHKFERMAFRKNLPDGFTAAIFHYLNER